MAEQQIFRGVLELASPTAFDEAAEASLGDPDESGARAEFVRARISERLVVLDVEVDQPQPLWGVWCRFLAELAARSVRGYVVAVRLGDEAQLEVFDAGAEAPPAAPAASPSRDWVSLRPGSSWTFESRYDGRAEEATWQVVEESGGAVSLRQRVDEPYHDLLGTTHLRQDGSAVLDVAPESEQVWLDTGASPGAAWLVHRVGQDLLRVQRFIGRSDVEVPAGVYPECQHYVLESHRVGRDLADPSPGARSRRPSSVELYLARGVGPVKLVAPGRTHVLLSLSTVPTASELPLPEMPAPEHASIDDGIIHHGSAAVGVSFGEGAVASAPATVVPIARAPVEPPLEVEEPSRWPRLSVYFGPRVSMFAAVAATVVVGWLLIRTPTRAGLAYHALGVDGPAPTVVVLHGYGAPGTDFVPFGERIAEQLEGLRVICVEAPYGVGFGNAWYLSENQRRRSRDQLVRFVRELESEGTPRSQIVVAGYSQGAAIATDVAVQLPGLAGLGILSGDHSTREPLEGRVFVSHGRSDTVLGFGVASHNVEVYQETAEVTFVPFDGGHEAQPIEPDFIRWLDESLPLGR